MTSVTPMMQQYLDARAACPDALLFFRMGDFYELFYDDAKTASRELGLTLTSRDKGENPVPMAGFPYHQLDSYLAKLIAAGYRAAVCEQVEDPRQAKGLVKRELTRVVTAGTITDDALLDPRESNYLAAVVVEPAAKPRANATSRNGAGGDACGEVGMAWADLSTGRFLAASFPASQLADQLARISPVECLAPEGQVNHPGPASMRRTARPAWAFGRDQAQETLCKHFGVATLEGFGFTDDDDLAIRAAGAVLDYLQETQQAALVHFDRIALHRVESTLAIDEASRRSLEITKTLRDGRREGSLLAALDRTITPMGARTLADWTANPLTQLVAIEARLDAVEELLREGRILRELREALKKVLDLERLLARAATGRASPRDLRGVGRTLAQAPAVQALLSGSSTDLLRELRERIEPCPELCDHLERALVDDCPLTASEGGFIKSGFDSELDRLRELASGGKEWIARYQASESARIGIANLKVGYNKVFGYYIELTNAQRGKAPAEYIRKQTLKNAERFITPELKEYEEKVLLAEDQALSLEQKLFQSLRDEVQRAARSLRSTAAALAQLDALGSLAEIAASRGYCRPKVVQHAVLEIRDGRHPVLDALAAQGEFTPNDTLAGTIGDANEGSILLITGPNMAGKSTYIRQTALIAIMAQIGSFVPARSCTIGVCDRVFARVGASDELARGQSTFMVEMTETARILNTATPQSLVILDEIGRGTSTYDGLSLAWAIVEHLHDTIGCRTLFATHYHELTQLAGSLSNVRNLNVAVKEWDDNVVFLHKIVPGAADKSYGIHVARLAGVPAAVNERAKQILSQLEAEHLDGQGKPKIAKKKKGRVGDLQLSLFGFQDHPLLDKIRQADLNQLTPLAALQLVQAWQEELRRER